ncbi:MAG: hypothetical protein AB1725_03990 [Armatimonadota bacterium]
MRRWIVVLLGVLAAAVVVGWLNQDLWSTWRIVKSEEHQRREELRAAEKEHGKTLEEDTRARSPIGREEMAREQGYIRKGETPLGVD